MESISALGKKVTGLRTGYSRGEERSKIKLPKISRQKNSQ
jgi:hypothetical protein